MGVYSKEQGRSLVNTENSRIPIPFKVMGDTKNAQELDKVLVKFVRWDPPARIPTCKILKCLVQAMMPEQIIRVFSPNMDSSSLFPKVEDEALVFGKKYPPKIAREERIFAKLLPSLSTHWMPGILMMLYLSRF